MKVKEQKEQGKNVTVFYTERPLLKDFVPALRTRLSLNLKCAQGWPYYSSPGIAVSGTVCLPKLRALQLEEKETGS